MFHSKGVVDVGLLGQAKLPLIRVGISKHVIVNQWRNTFLCVPRSLPSYRFLNRESHSHQGTSCKTRAVQHVVRGRVTLPKTFVEERYIQLRRRSVIKALKFKET